MASTCSAAYEARKLAQPDLDLATQSLIVEFGGSLSAGTVIRTVARAREELLRSGVRQGLAVATWAMARHRLQASVGPADLASARVGKVAQVTPRRGSRNVRRRREGAV